MDRFSPVAPAAVRITCLPVGSIGLTAFKTVIDRLQAECSIVELEQIHVPEDQEILLSPKINPKGCLLLNYTSHATTEREQQLSPYELFREPLIVLGIANGISDDGVEAQTQLKKSAEYLRERHPRVVHRHLLLLQESQEDVLANDNVTIVKHNEKSQDESSLLKNAICEVAARFLAEFSTYAKALQASPNVQTPGQTAKSIQKTMWLIGEDKRPASGSGTVTPTNDTGLSSPVAEGSPRPLPQNLHSSPPPRSVGSPPPSSSFDEIQRTALTRSDSNASKDSSGKAKRASSQDRASVHGFGPEISKSKAKDRGKARVGIVTAHIHMMAGQWNEALRMLTEHTNVSRKLNDHLWHAKGLEGMVVSMLLLAWAHLGFSVPLICYPGSEGEGGAKHRSKLSVNLGNDFWPADAAHQASVRRLSTSLPDLLKQIVSLYASAEGHLELPFMVVAEAKIRNCELLSVLLKAKGEFNDDALNFVVRREPKPPPVITAAGSLTKGSIAALVAEAQPQHDDEMATTDHVQLLAGVYGVYAALGMDRKKGLVLKDLVTLLTSALTKARKLGAAEVGIHPAASLSVESSMDTTLPAMHGAVGIDAVVDQVAQVFGIDLMPRRSSEANHNDRAPSFSTWRHFGGDSLRIELLRLLIAFYEASWDPHGVLRLTSSFLRLSVPCAALDRIPGPSSNVIKIDEQMSIASTIARTTQVYAARGVPDVAADYWDPFLLRAVGFANPDLSHSLVPREELGSKIKADDRVPGNPLLYDPNAKRAGTAGAAKHLLVRNEPAKCLLTLQNPLDFSIEIESIDLVTGDDNEVRLTTEDFHSATVGARCLQQLSISISPTSPGELSIVGASIKVACCRQQFFPIYSAPWASRSDLLVKRQSQKTPALGNGAVGGQLPVMASVSAQIVPAMPLLEIEHTSADQASLMLMDGEHQELDVVVRNVNNPCPAIISEIRESERMLRLKPDINVDEDSASGSGLIVRPGETTRLKFDVKGIAGVSNAQLELCYEPSPTGKDDHFGRVLRKSFSVTVDAALQIHHARVEDVNEEAFMLSFDLANYWQKSLQYSALVHHDTSSSEDGVLAPGEVVRLSMNVRRWLPKDADLEEVFNTLRQRVTVLWRTWDDSRFGTVNLRSLALSPTQLDMMRGPQHRMKMELLGEDDGYAVGSFVVVRVHLKNDAASESAPLMAELQLPSGERQIASVGVLHRVLPPVPAKSEVSVDFVVCPLMAGSMELHTSARDVALGEGGKYEGTWQTEASLVLNLGG